jgi:triacylglycerol lipase
MPALLAVETAPVSNPELVVVLHGMGRTRWSMARLAGALGREGYRVVNVSYPSRRAVESLAAEWLPAQLAAAHAGAAPRVHFVTHSLGGIVVRAWLREAGAPENLGRVVMLAPPNAGSEIAERLGPWAPYRWFTGANGARLGTGATALPQTLGAWPARGADKRRSETGATSPQTLDAWPAGGVASAPGAGELGVIAGDRSLNPLLAALLPRPNDGKVTVAATHLAGETAHVTLPYSHTWLAWRSVTIARVKSFLRTGRFA